MSYTLFCHALVLLATCRHCFSKTIFQLGPIVRKVSKHPVFLPICQCMYIEAAVCNSNLEQLFQPFSSYGTHKLITIILWHTKKYLIFFADLMKKRYNCDSFTVNGYCCVDCCHFFILQSKGKEISAPD